MNAAGFPICNELRRELASFRPSTGERFLDINGNGLYACKTFRCEEKAMIRFIAVFTFLLIVGVYSYVVLNPGAYSTLVLCFASFVLCVAILAVAPVWKVIFLLKNNPRKRQCHPAGKIVRDRDLAMGRVWE